MKKILIFILLLLIASSAFAFVDTSLFSQQKTIGYYMLSNSNTSSLSSGLVYSKKKANGRELNVVYTSYRSLYLLTNNITRLDLYEKMDLIQLGPVSLSGLAGLGLIYSPAVGGGLTFNVGGNAAAGINEMLNVSLPMLMSFYTDGIGMQMTPTINVKPNDYELFGGARVDVSMLTGQFNSGSMTMYYIFGVKKGI